jgi:hypothetical protein
MTITNAYVPVSVTKKKPVSQKHWIQICSGYINIRLNGIQKFAAFAEQLLLTLHFNFVELIFF